MSLQSLFVAYERVELGSILFWQYFRVRILFFFAFNLCAFRNRKGDIAQYFDAQQRYNTIIVSSNSVCILHTTT